MKQSFFIFAFLLSSYFFQAQVIPKSYVAYKTSEKIVVDGEAHERSWENAAFTSDFIDIEGIKKPKFQTAAKMIWDDDYLYFYAKMEEPHVWANLKKRDTIIFYNNDFEIFIDPDGDSYEYMEFEMNALNTIWDLLLITPYREGGHAVDNWDIHGIKTAVSIKGTLNDDADKDQYWSVEVAMPWSVLTEVSPRGIPADDFWRINFSRVNWDHKVENGKYSRKQDQKGQFLPEYNWVWSPQGVVNMHEPEHWGYVYFSTKTSDENVDFKIPDDEFIRWELFRLYRLQKQFYQKHKRWAKIDELKDSPYQFPQEEKITVSLEQHVNGWNMIAKSPFTKRTFLITNKGRIHIKE